ncbi:MAG TPA: permease, partial [Firmicutes bacterium]|nr:permease [Bacillota bacterium]
MTGIVLALLGVALAVILPGIGSAFGVGLVGQSA